MELHDKDDKVALVSPKNQAKGRDDREQTCSPRQRLTANGY
jgi:hypothetical protein